MGFLELDSKKSYHSGMTLPDGLKHTEIAPGYPALAIETPACRATIALHGAHLISWRPAGSTHPVIYTSPQAIYREGKAIRGGIPLCWPWFGAHPSSPDKHPSHGVARNRFWQLKSAVLENGEFSLTLSLPPDEVTSEHVPFPFHLEARFRLGRQLQLDLITTNLSSRPVSIGGALHSYFQVSDIEKISLRGLSGTRFIDTTRTPEITDTQQDENLTIQGEIDRI